MTRSIWLRRTLATAVSILGSLTAAHLLLPWYAAWGTSDEECRMGLPGDEIVSAPQTSYTLAVTIHAAPAEIWRWLVQMGQGRGGFYTHEWIENLVGARIENAGGIVSTLQHLEVGDRIRLTPDPYFGQPGQFMTVEQLEPSHALVFRQTLPNGALASWAIVLHPERDGTTRVLTRRRGGQPTLFDQVMRPGYVFMDRGVLRGLRVRAEARTGA